MDPSATGRAAEIESLADAIPAQLGVPG